MINENAWHSNWTVLRVTESPPGQGRAGKGDKGVGATTHWFLLYFPRWYILFRLSTSACQKYIPLDSEVHRHLRVFMQPLQSFFFCQTSMAFMWTCMRTVCMATLACGKVGARCGHPDGLRATATAHPGRRRHACPWGVCTTVNNVNKLDTIGPSARHNCSYLFAVSVNSDG